MKKFIIPFLAVFMLFSFSVVVFADTTPEPEQVEVSELITEPVIPEIQPETEQVEVSKPVTESVIPEIQPEPKETPTEVTESELMLNLNSATGIPDTLRVTFSLNGRDVAVVKGNQILYQATFPASEKTFLKIRLEGKGRLIGANFNFQPFTAPEIPVPVVQPPGGSHYKEEPEGQSKEQPKNEG